jgi:hypothetical protein
MFVSLPSRKKGEDLFSDKFTAVEISIFFGFRMRERNIVISVYKTQTGSPELFDVKSNQCLHECLS